MILDKIENSGLYSIGEKFEKAFSFIKQTDLSSLAPGKHEIDGKEIIAEINQYNTKDFSEGKIEGHKNHIDLHMLVLGEEYIGYTPKNNQEEILPYNTERDFTLYKGDVSLFPMKAGMFTILFPDDLHMPGIKISENIPVKKLVIKITV